MPELVAVTAASQSHTSTAHYARRLSEIIRELDALTPSHRCIMAGLGCIKNGAFDMERANRIVKGDVKL